MAMGIVNEKDFQAELNRVSSNLIQPNLNNQNTIIKPTATIVDSPTKGRGEGNVEVPNSLRTIIGETAITDGRHEAIKLAQSFGLSQSSASAYANGANSTSSYNDKPNENIINSVKNRVSKKAQGKLIAAIRHITEEKLENTKARDLAGIAKDMSAVIKNMEEDNETSNEKSNSPTFVFYSPQFRKEEVFDVMYTKE